MADVLEQLIATDLENVPGELRRFLFREDAPSQDGSEQSWGYFAHGFARAFESLARDVLQNWPNAAYLQMPLFYLGRHSMELALKWATSVVAGQAGSELKLEGHSLLDLWTQFLRVVEEAGFAVDDDWTAHCGKVVKHLHDFDPTGERFRYPANVAGVPFDYTRVEVEGLAKAQAHVFGYCDATLEMVRANRE